MNKYTIIFLVIILILIILWLFYYKSVESFSNKDDNYLYPLKDLQEICKKENNLLPAYGAELCMRDGKPDPYANCKCADKFGECKVCYPTQKKYESGSNVVYDATNSFS